MVENQKTLSKQEKRELREEILKTSKENAERWEKIKQETEEIMKELEEKCKPTL